MGGAQKKSYQQFGIDLSTVFKDTGPKSRFFLEPGATLTSINMARGTPKASGLGKNHKILI